MTWVPERDIKELYLSTEEKAANVLMRGKRKLVKKNRHLNWARILGAKAGRCQPQAQHGQRAHHLQETPCTALSLVRGATGWLARKVVGKVTLGQILEGPECPIDNSLDVFAEGEMIQPVFENCLPSGSCRRNSFVSTDDLLPVIPANFTKST